MEGMELTTPPDADAARWAARRVLVTGATGLVGSWLVQALLARGATVVALIQDASPQSELFRSGAARRIHHVHGALEDYPAVERALLLHEVDTVFHLGAQTLVGTAYRAPLQTFETNIRGSYHLLEACRRHADLVRRVVVASSDKAYGSQPSLPYVESMPLDARGPYDVSKACTDLLAQSYHHTYDLPVAVTRFGNVYGGGDLNWSRLIPDAIRCCLEGRRLRLRSDGTFTRDFIYVKDVVAGYLRVADGLDDDGVRGEAFNFSTEAPLAVREVAARIGRLAGRDDLAPIVENTARAEIRDQFLSAEKARTRLGWRPAYALDDGLRETIDWYRRFLQRA